MIAIADALAGQVFNVREGEIDATFKARYVAFEPIAAGDALVLVDEPTRTFSGYRRVRRAVGSGFGMRSEAEVALDAGADVDGALARAGDAIDKLP